MKTYSTGTFSGIKTAGFTLIELVVVIVILGILAASAAPKLMNMQGDARAATLIAIKGAVRSANNMVYSKSLITNANTTYTEKGDPTGAKWEEDCRSGSCVNMGNMWLYTKFGYIDRNSVSYVVDTDIGGNEKTKQVTNSKTHERITVPERGTKEGESNYNCPSGNNSVICKGHDFCQCRYQSFKSKETNNKERDTQIIVPKGFDYNINKHKNGGCYFGYSTSDKLKGNDPKPQPPAYTLRIGGC
ncbi:MAG: type II secretion system protein [Ruminobacter sp.]|nr:type II secretion system protein [Ruminobacter sp.]